MNIRILNWIEYHSASIHPINTCPTSPLSSLLMDKFPRALPVKHSPYGRRLID